VDTASRAIWIAAALLTLAACAVIPPESVKLSAAVGGDLQALRRSHTFYVNTFYGRLETETSNLVDQQFAPTLIAAALKGNSGATLMQKLEAGKAGGQAAQDAVVFVQHFLTNVNKNVEAERIATLGPIKLAHARALANLDAAYTQVAQENSTLTAYLESLEKLHTAQNELFAAAGAPHLQDDVASALSSASDEIDRWRKKAEAGEVSVDKATEEIRKILDRGTSNESSP